MWATQCTDVSRNGLDNSTWFNLILNVVWLLVPDGLVYVGTADLLGFFFSYKTVSKVYREWSKTKETISSQLQFSEEKSPHKSKENVQTEAERKPIVTQITTYYNQDIQKSISEGAKPLAAWATAEDHTGCHSSRISNKKEKLRLQIAWGHQNWKVKDCNHF